MLQIFISPTILKTGACKTALKINSRQAAVRDRNDGSPICPLQSCLPPAEIQLTPTGDVVVLVSDFPLCFPYLCTYDDRRMSKEGKVIP